MKQILISDTPLRTRLAPFDTFRIDSIDSPCMPRIYSSFQGISLLSLSERLTCNRLLSRLPSNTFPGLDFLFYTPSTPRFGSSISFASACAKRTRRSTSGRSHFLLLTWFYLSLYATKLSLLLNETTVFFFPTHTWFIFFYALSMYYTIKRVHSSLPEVSLMMLPLFTLFLFSLRRRKRERQRGCFSHVSRRKVSLPLFAERNEEKFLGLSSSSNTRVKQLVRIDRSHK